MNALDQIRDRLKKYPDLVIEDEGDRLTVKAKDATGFDVSISDDSSEYTVYFSAYHRHFESSENAIKYFYLGLSNQCRILVKNRGGFVYNLKIQFIKDGQWSDKHYPDLGGQTIFLLFPFWRKKEERYLQNNLI